MKTECQYCIKLQDIHTVNGRGHAENVALISIITNTLNLVGEF
jgi:hypothetical protein